MDQGSEDPETRGREDARAGGRTWTDRRPAKPDVPADETLYFLVREGSNVRAVSKDDVPVMVTEEQVDAFVEFYDPIVAPRVGRMVPMAVDDWYRRFELPKVAAKIEARRRAEQAVERAAEGAR